MGRNTGRVLSWWRNRSTETVYDLAVQQFPIIKYIIPFSVFSAWVDEALVWMRQQIDANAKIAEYVETPFATLQLSDIVSNSKEQ